MNKNKNKSCQVKIKFGRNKVKFKNILTFSLNVTSKNVTLNTIKKGK